jgi:hypothetical protein
MPGIGSEQSEELEWQMGTEKEGMVACPPFFWGSFLILVKES